MGGQKASVLVPVFGHPFGKALRKLILCMLPLGRLYVPIRIQKVFETRKLGDLGQRRKT